MRLGPRFFSRHRLVDWAILITSLRNWVRIPFIHVTKDLRASLSGTGLFLQELLLYPQQIGAVFPSSKRLASVMANWLPPDPEDFVLELGPGTGVVTQALLDRGLREDRLIAIEMSARLADLLRERYPRACILTGNACNLDKLLHRHVREVEWVGSVISSLPLRAFPPDAVRTLAARIRGVLRPTGKWVQYSYYLGRAVPEATARFDLLATNVVWLNLPPARVNVYQKRAAH